MKNGIAKRALCLLLAALVCLAMLPAAALAGADTPNALYYDVSRVTTDSPYDYGSTDGYLERNANGQVKLCLSGGVAKDNKITAVYLVTADSSHTRKATLYDGAVPSGAEGGLDTEWGNTVWIRNVVLSLEIGDYQTEYLTDHGSLYSVDYQDEYVFMPGVVHVVAQGEAPDSPTVNNPTISTSSLPSGKVGEAYKATLSGTAADSSTLSWSVEGSLPAGLALNEKTGVISGTPTAEGSFSFAVKATQDNGKAAMKSLSISVSQPATYTVRFDLNGGTATPDADYGARTGVADGAAITLPAAPSRDNYAFLGWNSGGKNYPAGSKVDVRGNMTFTAAWDTQTVTFTFAPELVGYVALYGVTGSGRENLCSSYLEQPGTLTGNNAFTLSAERCSGFTSFVLYAIVDGVETEITECVAVAPGSAANTTAALTSKENFRILTGVVVKAGGKTLEKGRDYYDFALTSGSENQLYSVPCLIDKNGTYSGNFFSSSSSEIYRDYDFNKSYEGIYDNTAHTLTFNLTPAAKVTVSGTVTMNGTPLSGVTVRACENGDKSIELSATTDPAGKYSFDLYPGGSVYFNVTSRGQPLSVSSGYALALPAGESGPVPNNLTVNYASLNVSFRLGSQDQEALIDRYLNALPNQDSVLTVSRGDTVVQQFSGWQLYLYKPDFTRNFSLSSVGPTDALTVKLSGSRLAAEAIGAVTLAGGIGSVTLNPTLQCGVVGRLEAASYNVGQFYLAWYNSAGACVGETDSFFAGGHSQDIAAVCPGDPGQYTLLLLPSTYKGMLFNFTDNADASTTPMTLDQAREMAVNAWENITLTAGQITELEPFTITAGMSEDAEYVTKPASTLACGTDSFTDVHEMVMFNGSIGLDPGLTGGKLAGLNIVTQPGDGNTAVIQSLIIAGKTYMLSMSSMSSTGYYYIDLRSGGNAVIDLPCDYTIYCKPGAVTMDMDVQVTATVTYGNGGERNNQLVGSAVVKKPGSFVTTLSPFVCHDQITVMGVAKKNEEVTIYDNGVEVGRTRGDDRSGKWTANITLNGTDSKLATVHPITAATASGTVSEETTVIHQAGGPELTSFTMEFNNGQPFDVLGGAYIYPMGMSNVKFTAKFDNPDKLKNLGGADGFNCDVVIRFLTTNGKIYHWKAEHRGNGVFVATQPGNIGSSITEAEVLFDAEIVRPFYNEKTKTYAMSSELNQAINNYISEVETKYNKTVVQDQASLWNATPDNNWSISFSEASPPNVSNNVSAYFDSAKLQALAEAYKADGVALRSMGMEYKITDTSPLARWMQESVDDKLTDHRNEDQIYMASILFGSDADMTAEENVAKANAIVEAHTEGGSSSVYTITDGKYNDDGELTGASYALILQFSRDATRGLYVLGATLLLDATYTGEANQVTAASATRLTSTLRAVSDMSYASTAPVLMLAKNVSTSTRMVEDYYHGRAPVPSGDGASFFHADVSGVVDFSANGFGAGGLGQGNAYFTSSATGVGFSAVGYFLTQYDAGQREGFYRRMLRDLNHLMSTSCYHNLSYQQKVRCANLYNDFLNTYKRTLERNQETVDISRVTLVGGLLLCNTGGIPGGICLVAGAAAGWMGADNAVKAEIETILSYNSAYNQMAFLMYNKDDPNCNKDKFKIREIREFVQNSGLTVANDPSGVVYEGVIENPVKGAAVTLYHAVDGNGGLVREAEATEVANIVPASGVNGLIPEEWVQTTGADGRFQWGVPEGLWYVTAEANGLAGNSNGDREAKVTLSSGIQVGGQVVTRLLPVLPVQMDVNIPLTDPAPPAVTDLQFTTEGVYVTFSKYMQEKSSGDGAYDCVLDTDVYVLTDSNGEKIAMTVASEEQGHTPDNRGKATTYTRTVVLKRADGAAFSGNLSLLVRGSVKSYAGTPMGSDYTSGARAVTEKVTLSPPMFSGTNKSGTAFSNSSQVTQVMALGESVTLTAAVPEGKNVLIYYTTDGTSPSAASKLYERPIPITNAMTITAIAVCPGYTTSGVATGTFTVGETHIISARVSPYDASLSTDGVTVTLSGNGVSRTAQVLNGSAAFDGLSDGTYTLSFAATASFSAATVSVTVAGANEQVQVTLQRAGTEDPYYNDYEEPAYVPTITEPEHGKVTVKPEKAASGETVTITITPDEGYELDMLTVTDASGKEVAVTKNADGTFSFKQPAGKVTIKATFKESAAPERPFDDVKEADWFYDAVYYCFDKGYFKGTGTTTFSPKATMTRAMFATVLWRIAGEPAAEGGKSFNDVEDGKWYTDAVLWASGEGILDGYGDGTFGTNDPVTREQMVALLWRYSGKPAGTADLSGYKDANQISDWAREAFAWAVSVGLVQGKGDGILDPGGKATRAEVAQIVMNYDAKVK